MKKLLLSIVAVILFVSTGTAQVTSSDPNTYYRDTDKSVTQGGLGRIRFNDGKFTVEFNTAAAGNFSGVTTVLSITSGGVITFTGPIIAPTIGPNSSQQHTLPAVTSDTFALLAASQTLTNKTLTSPTINGATLAGTFSGAHTVSGVATFSANPVISAITNTGTLTLPTSTDTLVGRTTTDTLTNKTISGSSNTLSNIANASLSNSSVTVTAGTGMSGGGSVALGAAVTLTNAGVTSAIGTSNQVSVSGATGAVTFSLPQSIAAASSPTFAGLTLTGQMADSYTSVASTPAGTYTGTWFTGGSATTTKPHFLIEPTGTTSTGWSTSGTGLGVNATSGFTGNLIDSQLAGTSKFKVTSSGAVTALSSIISNGGNVGAQAGGLVLAYSSDNSNYTQLVYSGTNSGGTLTTSAGTLSLIANNGSSALILSGTQLQSPVGSASVPTYSFTGQTGTGAYYSSGYAISIGGTQVGLFGIARLTVTGSTYGNAGTTNTVFNGSASTGQADFIGSGANWAFRTDTNGQFHIDGLANGGGVGSLITINTEAAAVAGGMSIGPTAPASKLDINGNISNSSWTTGGIAINSRAATYTDTGSAGTRATAVANSFGIPTYAGTNAVTITDAANVYIAGAPTAGTNATLTNAYALWAAAGNSRLDGGISVGRALSTAYQLDVYANSVSTAVKAETAFATGYTVVNLVNPNGAFQIFKDRSTGGAAFSGSTANAGVLVTTDSTPIQFATNNTLALTIGTAQQLTAVVGSASVPTYSFAGNTGYGMYLASSAINFANAGSSIFKIMSTGVQLGVGGTSSNPAIAHVSFQTTGFIWSSGPSLSVYVNGLQAATFQPGADIKLSGDAKSIPAWGTNGVHLQVLSSTTTDTSSSGTVATAMASSFARPTFAASSATTYTDAATLYIANSPASGTNVTITNPWALYVAAGSSNFNGTAYFQSTLNANGVLVANQQIQSSMGASASTPALVSASFTSTGLYWSNGPVLNIAANGTRMVSINSTGLGLGSSSAPGHWFEIFSGGNEAVSVYKTTGAGTYISSAYWDENATNSKALNIYFTGSTYTGPFWSNGTTGQTAGIGTQNATALTFATNGSERMSLGASTGQLLHNTTGSKTAPNYSFTAATNYGMFYDSTNSGVTLTANGTSSAIFTSANLTLVGQLTMPSITSSASGDYTCYDTTTKQLEQNPTPCTLSGEQHKHDIVDLGSTLQQVLQARTVEYVRNDHPELGKMIGFTAQSMLKAEPRLVVMKDGVPNQVLYENSVPWLVKAFQEDHWHTETEFTVLRSEVESLRKEIQALRKDQ